MTDGTRRVLLKLHLWLGLATALPMLVVALTGAFLVYGEEADEALDPQLFKVAAGPSPLPVQELYQRVRDACPAETVVGCALPKGATSSFSCHTRSRLYVYVDPYTGRVLGSKHLETGLRRKMFLVHSQLMAGKAGHTIVMVSTGVSIVLIVTGVLLWLKFKILGVTWKANAWRVNFDLHSVLGLYAAVFFLILSVTGFLIGYDSFFYPLILKASGGTPMNFQAKSRPAGGGDATLDAVIAAARQRMPEATVRYVGLAQKPEDPVSIYLRQPEDPTAFGRSRVRVDRYRADVLVARDTRSSNWGEAVVDFTEAVHFGDIYGTPTRLIAFMSSLAAAGQVLTGFFIWWKRQ
jgi:uncharacterized iron-regulated membrane protein